MVPRNVERSSGPYPGARRVVPSPRRSMSPRKAPAAGLSGPERQVGASGGCSSSSICTLGVTSLRLNIEQVAPTDADTDHVADEFASVTLALPEVKLHPTVVEQGVVDVEQDDKV